MGSLDVIFPVLHGTFGEDGTVQGLFELASVPYAGAGVLGSALGMDKLVQKTLWRGLGLPVVEFMSVRRRELERHPDGVIERIEAELGYPCFTKPANLGSSVGVSKARNRTELEAGLRVAARYDGKLLVERGIDARERDALCGGQPRLGSLARADVQELDRDVAATERLSHRQDGRGRPTRPAARQQNPQAHGLDPPS